MKQTVHLDDVTDALKPSPWDMGNQILYDLCRAYPEHKRDEEIVAKIWLIGRAYSAAIERRKNVEKVKGGNEGFL